MRRNSLLRTCLVILAALGLATIALLTGNAFETASVQTGSRLTFLQQFVIAGGPIVWFVLLPMSLVAVYLAIDHSLTIRRARLLPHDAARSISETIRRFGVERANENLAQNHDLISIAVRHALGKGAGDWFRMRSALAESLQDQAMLLFRRIEWISLIGNVSPMVGLFGTVFGMIKLFNAIVISGGQPQAAQLAGGISVALVTTFWGLFIAIPALALHGVFRNRIETLVSEAVAEAESVMPHIKQALKSPAKSPPPQPKAPAAIVDVSSHNKTAAKPSSLAPLKPKGR